MNSNIIEYNKSQVTVKTDRDLPKHISFEEYQKIYYSLSTLSVILLCIGISCAAPDLGYLTNSDCSNCHVPNHHIGELTNEDCVNCHGSGSDMVNVYSCLNCHDPNEHHVSTNCNDCHEDKQRRYGK